MSKEKLYQYKDFGSKPDQETEIKTLKELLKEKDREIENLRKEDKSKDALIAGKDTRIAELIEQVRNMGIDKDVTGLPNRREHFLDEVSKIFHFKKAGVEEEKEHFQERKEGFKHASIIFCDIDNFKSFNDKFGHEAGDFVLKRISEILKENLRINDRICRWGGEEIIIALMGDDIEESKKVAERLRQAVNDFTAQFKNEYPNHPDINEVVISLSLGLSALSADKELDTSIREADAAMYVAKKLGGKNCVKVFSELDEKERQTAEKFLKKSREKAEEK